MGLDNRPQTILRRPISLIGIGMMYFDLFLVFFSNFCRFRVVGKAERFECLGFKYLEFSQAKIRFLLL